MRSYKNKGHYMTHPNLISNIPVAAVVVVVVLVLRGTAARFL